MFVGNLKKQLLINYSRVNNIPTLKESDVRFRGLTTVSINGCNTRITIESVGSNFTGSGVIYYNRYKIADYFRGFNIPTYVGYFKTKHELIRFLRESWNMPLFEEEFEDAPITLKGVILTPLNSSMHFLPGNSIVINHI